MKSVLALLGVSCSLLLSAQEANIMANRQSRKAYFGIDNPLNAFVEGYKCSSLSVTTDNGRIENHGCRLNLNPAHVGIAKLSVYLKQKGTRRLVKSFMWEIHPLPAPTAQVGPFKSGSNVLRGDFVVQLGVGAFLNGFGFDLQYKVQSFFVIIRKETTILLAAAVKGAAWNEPVQKALGELKPGMVVLITDILVIGPDGTVTKATPLEYFII